MGSPASEELLDGDGLGCSGAPTRRTARFWTKFHSMGYSSCAESSVGMKRADNSVLPFPGHSQGVVDRFQGTQLPVFRSTRNTMIASS